jgi:hypothetical protein
MSRSHGFDRYPAWQMGPPGKERQAAEKPNFSIFFGPIISVFPAVSSLNAQKIEL